MGLFELPTFDKQREQSRSQTFDHRPDEQELGEPLGWGEMAGGYSVQKDESGRWLIVPQLIPVHIIKYWMALVLIGCIAVSIWFAIQKPWTWPFVLVGMLMGCAAVPTMIGLFTLINKKQGSEPYAIVDSRRQTLRLPRLDGEWSVEQIESVWLLRFADRLTQLTIVIRETGGRWTHAHVMNATGGIRLNGLPSHLATQLGCQPLRAEV